MTPLLLVSIVATIGAAMGLVSAIREERRKSRARVASALARFGKEGTNRE